MGSRITRRNFIIKSAALAASSSIGSIGLSSAIESGLNSNLRNNNIDVAVAAGSNYFENTVKAVEILGGMSKYVPKNSSVLLLGNVWRVPGTFTKPDIFHAVAGMCRDAGAGKVKCVSMMPRRNWEITGNKAALEKENVELKLFDYKDYSQFTTIPIPGGKILKQAEILKDLFVHDVFINIPLCKDHVSTVFSCAMKNLMGLTSYRCNRKFHIEERDETIDKANYLAQCIADLNTVITPTLNVVDATEFIATNGPMGPGRIIKPRKVVAGVDRVAIDAYCIALLDKNINNVIKIKKGYEHGLGEMDISKVRIHEEEL
jgi:uncharacterized protein (DUF362 family)